MAARPGDETEQTGGAPARPHPEHVIEALKAAFAQGRLGKDEFDQRVGKALSVYTALDELTADIPAARPAAPPPVEAPQVTREAYNRGLVARGTFCGAGGVGLLAAIVVTAVTGNPFAGFMLGGALAAFIAVVLGTILTLILWVLESSDGRSSRRTRPPEAGFGTTERLASAEQADQARLPGKPRRDGRHTADAAHDRHLTRGCSQAWA
jgi:hypothetical protein